LGDAEANTPMMPAPSLMGLVVRPMPYRPGAKLLFVSKMATVTPASGLTVRVSML